MNGGGRGCRDRRREKEAAMQQTLLSSAAQRTLEAWHEILERNAMEELDPWLAEEIVFRSPVAHQPYPGMAASKWVLMNVNQSYDNFTYHRSIDIDEGSSTVL